MMSLFSPDFQASTCICTLFGIETATKMGSVRVHARSARCMHVYSIPTLPTYLELRNLT